MGTKAVNIRGYLRDSEYLARLVDEWLVGGKVRYFKSNSTANLHLTHRLDLSNPRPNTRHSIYVCLRPRNKRGCVL